MENNKEQTFDVKFKAKLSMYNNNVCDGCHKTAQVVMLRIPHTRYYANKRTGKRRLYTKYDSRYYCRECADQLESALLGTAWDQAMEIYPCKDCDKRHPNCHADCDAYKAKGNELKPLKDALKEQHLIDKYFDNAAFRERHRRRR